MMHSVVVGLGKTGASCLRYLAKHGVPVRATDSRIAPPGLSELGDAARDLDLRLGGFDLSLLEDASQVVISPGVSLDEPIAAAARARGIEILGDVELFARAVRAPVIGITGTNGKSTVTALVAHMAAAAGWRVLAGGNLGEPALDLLGQPEPDLYVLELSSFQLDTTRSLRPIAAAVLNVSADHLDRYPSVEEYAAAKARIFAKAATLVVNADDVRVMRMADSYRGTRPDAPAPSIVTFSVARATQGPVGDAAVSGHSADFVLVHEGGEYEGGEGGAGVHPRTWLARRGERLLALADLKISGLHNAANALAALALGEAAGLPMAAMCEALRSFAGLAHRSAWVADVGGVRYVDDSKGTNVGATIAAVAGMPGPLVMIVGGEGKGQDFAPLRDAFLGKVRHAVLIGKDAAAIATVLAGACGCEFAASMAAAVEAASRNARSGDTVLLSPACASLDMFRDYRHRGESFAAAVHSLAAGRALRSDP